ncbi:hypothetical protein [Actinoplanes sp. NPDC051411]|uniref:hypothetical protein n=1 Tax=Actinoplanes sp. NPDC051411 TaxID=3155522 RepID=UPI0034287F0D
MSKWRLVLAGSVALTGSLMLGSAAPSSAPPGETISLVDWHGHSSDRQAFQIRTSSTGLLYPGATRKISLTIVNPNPFPITVRMIKGRLASTSRTGCRPTASNLQVRPYTGRLPLVVAPFGRRDAGHLELHMPGSVVDACQRARFVIHIDSDAARSGR